MSTDRRIQNIRFKSDRANKHILTVDSEIRAFRESKPYAISAKPHPVPQIEHTTLCVSSVKPVPESIALITGDAVHNLRSTLDHLAWQLVEAGVERPLKILISRFAQVLINSLQQLAREISIGCQRAQNLSSEPFSHMPRGMIL